MTNHPHRSARRWRLHAASVEMDGLHLSAVAQGSARSLREALVLAEDYSLHGPEGVAIVSPAGRVIYTAVVCSATPRG